MLNIKDLVARDKTRKIINERKRAVINSSLIMVYLVIEIILLEYLSLGERAEMPRDLSSVMMVVFGLLLAHSIDNLSKTIVTK